MQQPDIILALNEAYNTNPGTFDFSAGQYIAGDQHAQLRRSIYETVTRNPAPRQVSTFQVTDALKNYFTAPTLF